jgi:hypothetical protein
MRVEVREAIEVLITSLIPGSKLLEIKLLAPDSVSATSDPTAKVAGYGLPLCVRSLAPDNSEHWFVLHTASANDFGHDRRADRAEGMLLCFDNFSRIPQHVRAIDVGTVLADNRLLSLQGAGEFYLLTSYAPGTLYAEDLRRLAHQGAATPLDLERCEALARYLLSLHQQAGSRPAAYARALRDLVGHGEGIFGIIDGYPEATPAAAPERLMAIEQAAAEWRWRLRGRADRLVRTHGDFHPFNVVFDQGAQFTLLDASRGCEGDRADDITSMTINYLFFALEQREAWNRGLGVLWRRFWQVYRQGSSDTALLEACPPYFAWRALVLANPAFYPGVTAPARECLLGLAERALRERRFEPIWAEELFA